MLREVINTDFIAAYKAKDMEKKNFLGVLKGEITKKTKEPSDDEVITVVKSMIKTHTKSLEETGQPSLTDSELTILEGYLPEQYSEDKIRDIIGGYIATEGDKVNMGFLMGCFNRDHGGKADNKLVSQIVKELLSA